jgi:serine protease Do
MLTPKVKRAITLSGSSALALICIIALNFGWFNNLIAEISTPTIGAAKPPVTMSQDAAAINNAIMNAADAVNPTIVAISVLSEVDGVQQFNFNGFEDFFGFGFPDRKRRNDEDADTSKPKQRGSGSGVVITADGYIVTNRHVVKGATEDGITVTTWDKKEYPAKLIGEDSLSDLAVIKIDASNMQMAHFANADSTKIGMMVIAVGNPLGLSHTVTQGIISALGREQIGLKNSPYAIENFIQTDAAINPGNSGGGLFNLNGSLVGINTAIATTSGGFQGYGFAIPIDIVKATVTDLIKTGKVNRGYIGAQVANIDDKFAKHLGLAKVEGVFVQSVNEGSPAEKAGIQEEDVILKVNDRSVSTVGDLRSAISRYRAGDEVTLTIWRDKKEITKKCKLESATGEEEFADNKSSKDGAEKSSDNSTVTFEKLGFTIEPLTDAVKEKFDVKSGVYVKSVKRYSPAADGRLQSGCVITKIDREEIKTTGQFKKIIESKSSGETVMLHLRVRSSGNSTISYIIVLEIP